MSIDLSTPAGTRILVQWHDKTDIGTIDGTASSQCIFYTSDKDGLTYGIAAWEFDRVTILP